MYAIRRLFISFKALFRVSKHDLCTNKLVRSIFLAVTLTILSVGCSSEETDSKPKIRPVRAIQVSEPQLLGGRWFPGRAEPTEEVDLSFRVGGPLISRPINVGDVVRTDQTLAQIDPQDYSVRLKNVKGQLGTAMRNFELAEKEYKRVIRIQVQDPGAISEAVVDRALAARDGSRDEVNSLKASVQHAKDQLSYTKLKAPFDGTVVGIFVENFQDVKPKQPVLRLINLSRIEMWVDIPEQLISRASHIKSMRVRFDTFPGRVLSASIKEIGKEATQATGTYPVNLIMDQPSDFTILPGMAGEAQAEIELPADYTGDLEGSVGMEIPVSAVFSDKDRKKSYVWVVADGDQTIHRREVQAGRVSDDGILIRKGLQAGEWVVTAGVAYLEEGQKVKLPVEVSETSPLLQSNPDKTKTKSNAATESESRTTGTIEVEK
jgi:RND family efflux transporter MFP subunit